MRIARDPVVTGGVTGPTTGTVGEPLTATVTLTNPGPSDSGAVNVRIALIGWLVLGTGQPSQGTVDFPSFTWHAGSVPAGTSATLDLTLTPSATGSATVAADLPGGTQTLSITVEAAPVATTATTTTTGTTGSTGITTSTGSTTSTGATPATGTSLVGSGTTTTSTGRSTGTGTSETGGPTSGSTTATAVTTRAGSPSTASAGTTVAAGGTSTTPSAAVSGTAGQQVATTSSLPGAGALPDTGTPAGPLGGLASLLLLGGVALLTAARRRDEPGRHR
jgi:hypothetical protein